jgi:hypothetical protein
MLVVVEESSRLDWERDEIYWAFMISKSGTSPELRKTYSDMISVGQIEVVTGGQETDRPTIKPSSASAKACPQMK